MRSRLFLSIVALLSMLAGIASAQQPPAGAVDQKCADVLKRLCDYHKNVTSLVATVEGKVVVQTPGRKSTQSGSSKIAIERPNRFAVKGEEGAIKGMRLSSNGERLLITSPEFDGRYADLNAPKDFDSIIKEQQELAMLSTAPMIITLFASDAYEIFLDGVLTGKYVGQETYGGIAMDHIAFTQADHDWELWVDAGETPTLWRSQEDLSKTMAGAGQNVSAIQTVTLISPTYNTKIAAEAWTVPIPAGAKKTSSLMEALTGEKGPVAAGEKAPEIELTSLDGTKRTLSSHRGKDIVVIDFWATWCPPCRAGLPIIDANAKKYSGRGVAFYAVNLRENEAKIRPFMKQMGLSLTVLLDSDGAVGAEYGVSGIPTTVIIDKEGTIQSVHTGLPPDLETRLPQEIDTLLAGKPLS